MATVSSFTEAKIRELLSGWEGVALDQEQINIIIDQMRIRQDALEVEITEFNDVTLPQLRDDLAAGSIRVSELNDTTIPNLEQKITVNEGDLQDLNTVTLPALRSDLDSSIVNSLSRPQMFFADEPPVSTVDRELQVGDVWHDTNDGNKQHRWDGTAWVSFSVDVADFSLTVKKFLTNTHQIY